MRSNFINACFGEAVRRRPIWIMRQAGRYQASYRAIRETRAFWDVCRTPELSAQVTLQPVADFDFDAAIIFSDIMVIFPPMGVPVEFVPGPKITAPIRSMEQIEQLRRLDPHTDLDFVLSALRQTRSALADSVSLIGFSGAPFTLACYALEGGSSREFNRARRFFHEDPQLAELLMRTISDAVADYLNAQMDSGADAVQLFDSWGGLLSAEDYRRWVLPHMQSIIERIKRPGVPVILYVNGSSHLLNVMSDVGCDVLSVDGRTTLTSAAHSALKQTAIQGNLDPLVLFAGPDEIVRRSHAIMAEIDQSTKGHVFNLGHGILPETPEDNVRLLVETVHALTPKHAATSAPMATQSNGVGAR